MFAATDTIVAIATPPGRAGIGVVRLSGPDAPRIAAALSGRHEPFSPRYATLTRIAAAGTADRVVITAFPSPHSYTGDDVVEISGHGSPVLLRSIVRAAMEQGARLAQPGEFTLRAYLNGRVDLVQAEAVRDLVDAVTPLQARAAFDQLEGTLTHELGEIDAALFDLTTRLEASLDFPDEGYHFVAEGHASKEISVIQRRIAALLGDAARGRLLREGVQVVLAGRPNSGKSSLFNALAGRGRAIVTDVPGTTRDLLTEVIDVDGVPVTIVDTAGLRREAADAIEAEGIARAEAARQVAGVVIVVLDSSAPLTADDRALLEATKNSPRVVVSNKCDLPLAWSADDEAFGSLRVSALHGDGLDALRRAIVTVLAGGESLRDVPAVTNLRHVDLLTRADAALGRAAAAAGEGVPEEFVLADVSEARQLLEEVTGRRSPDDVLAAIFAKFCIGK